MKYHIVTYGCQMNKNDSERIAAVLEKTGMKKAKDKNSADIVIINTCSVRQTAEDRIFGEVRNIINQKTKKPKNRKTFIAVTGCLAGRDKDGAIKKKLTGVDLFFKIDELPFLPQLIINSQFPISASAGHLPKGDNKMPNDKKFKNLGIKNSIKNLKFKIKNYGKREGVDLKVSYLAIFPKSDFTASRYITIQTGCDEFCSYCVVPYARGREYNRPFQEILREAKKMIREGATEITLLGQIVNKWQAPDPQNFSKDNPFVKKIDVQKLEISNRKWKIKNRKSQFPVSNFNNPIWAVGPTGRIGQFTISEQQVSKKQFNHFAALLWEMNQLEGLSRLSFISPHPRYMDDEIVRALALPKMANYLHLPVQSGDDEILRKMNRKHTAADYLKIIKKIRKVKPGIELGTDIIVGFPGETQKRFQNTVKLCKKVGFNVGYIAMYSPRSGTAAYKNFPDNISREIKKKRWFILDNLINK